MLKFDYRFKKHILEGTKTITIRDEMKAYPGEVHACFDDVFHKPFAFIRIKDVMKSTISGDVSKTSFAHFTDLEHYLRDKYGDEVADNNANGGWYWHEFELTEAPNG